MSKVDIKKWIFKGKKILEICRYTCKSCMQIWEYLKVYGYFFATVENRYFSFVVYSSRYGIWSKFKPSLLQDQRWGKFENITFGIWININL
jgi:hypothetical protein